MSRRIVLITGANGFIGFACVLEALRRGYDVKATVRRESAVDDIKSAPSIVPYLDRVSFEIVPDITDTGAFNTVLKDERISDIIHVASPLPPSESTDVDKDLLQPAIRATMAILQSASLHHNIKRIVITSSIAAVMRLSAYAGKDSEVFSANSRVLDPEPPFPNMMAAYAASKIRAFNATEQFVQEQKPHFTVVNILPSYVVGKHEIADTPEKIKTGSNMVALGPVFGVKNPDGRAGVTVHIDDVAYLHIAALDTEKIDGNRNFGANSHHYHGIQWNDGIAIVKQNFPKEVETGVFPLGGDVASVPVKFDAQETERVFGFTFKPWEQQVVDAARWYAEVYSRTVD